jgi:hypothetical protein
MDNSEIGSPTTNSESSQERNNLQVSLIYDKGRGGEEEEKISTTYSGMFVE